MEKAESKLCHLIVQDWLAENIAQGTLTAGSRLTIAGVAQRLNVSRSPVVRAMENLVAAETLTQQGRAGYLVGPAPADAADRAQVVNLFTLPVILPDTSARQSGNGCWPILPSRSKTAFRFGIRQISESAMCKHFAVSRTVTRDVLSGLHERSTFQKDRTSHRVAEPLSGRRLDEQHEVRRLLEPAGPQKATSLLAPADLAAMLTRLKAATPGCA